MVNLYFCLTLSSTLFNLSCWPKYQPFHYAKSLFVYFHLMIFSVYFRNFMKTKDGTWLPETREARKQVELSNNNKTVQSGLKILTKTIDTLAMSHKLWLRHWLVLTSFFIKKGYFLFSKHYCLPFLAKY